MKGLLFIAGLIFLALFFAVSMMFIDTTVTHYNAKYKEWLTQ